MVLYLQWVLSKYLPRRQTPLSLLVVGRRTAVFDMKVYVSTFLNSFFPQGDYDPVRTRVLHFKMNPTTVAKQQRQQEVEALREEVTHLRELVRSLQDLGRSPEDPRLHISNLSLSLPPSKEVQGRTQTGTSCLLQ